MRLKTDQDERGGDQRRAFTLVELVVAAAITVALAAMMLSLMVQLLDGWSRTQGGLTTERRAQRVLDQLAQDLQGAIARDDGNVWLAATVQPGPGASGGWIEGRKPGPSSLNPAAANLADARFGVGGVWLRFFTRRVSADPLSPDPAGDVAVAYQIVRRTPTEGGTEAHYLLYRSEVSAAATFAAGYDLAAAAYSHSTETEGAPGNVTHPVRPQAIADHVIDFGLCLYGRTTGPTAGSRGLQRWWPAGTADLEFLSPARPVAVDAMVRLLTEDGARRIAALEAGQISGDWWEMAAAHSRVFTRRIALPANHD